MTRNTGAPITPAVAATITRPIESARHPIETGNYRIATSAIQAFYELIGRCLRYRITGALTYGPPRIGKTRAIEYLRLLLTETHPKVTTYHAQAEHKPRHAEGPFFTNLLEAVGYPQPETGSNSAKRMRLINKIREACSRNGSGTVILFCDEAHSGTTKMNTSGYVTCMTIWTAFPSSCSPFWSASKNCWP
jgi:hypothetical protein